MGKQEHDLAFMSLVLLFAFVFMSLSVNQLNPDMLTTENAVRENYFMQDLIKKTSQPADIKSVDGTDFLRPITVRTSGSISKILNFFKTNSPTGFVVQGKNSNNCEWVNLDNKNYDNLKTLSGSEVCRAFGYDKCNTVNSVKTKNYYNSDDGACSELVIQDNYNDFKNCDSTIKTVNTPCHTETIDVNEFEYTEVLCCN